MAADYTPTSDPETVRRLQLDDGQPVWWFHYDDPTPRESALLLAARKARASKEYANKVMAVMHACLHCRIRVTPAEAVYIFSARWGSGARRIARFLRTVDHALGRVEFPAVNGRPNPNNGMLRFTVDLGREHSEVLYIKTYAGVPFTHTERAWITVAAHQAFANEIDFVHPDCLRVWWD